MSSTNNKYLISTDPARGYEEVGRVPISTKEEVEISVQRAREALPAWRALSVKDRGEYFQRFLALYKDRVEELAELQTREMGKPITESLSECNGRAATLELNIERSIKVLESQILDAFDTYQTELHFEPHGVVAAIAPWNYPTSQFLIAVGQPLLAGNTIDGVFTCLYGDGDVGEMLLDQDIDLIMFTGSSRVGEMIYRKAAEKFIPAVLEMGGSSPAVVFDDADLDETCLSIFNERFSNNGQICCALKRLIVHESIYDQVIEKLTKIIDTQVIVEDARDKGATIVVGGKQVEGLDGAYYMPTLITNTTPSMKVATEEVFGPVLPIITFKTEEEALRIAHDTPYGLSAFVYSKNLERADRIAHALEAGQVSINGCSYFSTNAPFGGYKRSGIGRTKGDIGFLQITKQKVISRPIRK